MLSSENSKHIVAFNVNVKCEQIETDMAKKSKDLSGFQRSTKNDQQKIEILNKLIASKPTNDDLFSFYKERVELYYHTDAFENALKDIESMAKLTDIPSDIKLIKWKCLIQVSCSKISKEIRESLSVDDELAHIQLLSRIHPDNIAQFLNDEEKLNNKRKRKC